MVYLIAEKCFRNEMLSLDTINEFYFHQVLFVTFQILTCIDFGTRYFLVLPLTIHDMRGTEFGDS